MSCDNKHSFLLSFIGLNSYQFSPCIAKLNILFYVYCIHGLILKLRIVISKIEHIKDNVKTEKDVKILKANFKIS